MFTVTKEKNTPRFSDISGNPHVSCGPEAPHVIYTKVGEIIQEELNKFESFRPDKIKILKSVIMPDHIHLIAYVKKNLDFPVTTYFAKTLSACTGRLIKQGLIPKETGCFKPGICDRIINRKGQFYILNRYIEDNPRRLLIKRLKKDLFSRLIGIKVGEYEINSYGNLFLLRLPLFAVHVRRKWSFHEVEEYKAQCMKAVAEGYVLISPFIHPAEREIKKASLQAGGSVIKLSDRGFGERWKPPGIEFDLCAKGRILYLAESESPLHKEELTYRKASQLNEIAEFLSQTPEIRMVVKGSAVAAGASHSTTEPPEVRKNKAERTQKPPEVRECDWGLSGAGPRPVQKSGSFIDPVYDA
ncbi:MAG: transposase [Muribaculaceae bacterium]|nr:transposase [Muribaculaceae bacterium]